MANPQTEKGFIKIASGQQGNDILMALVSANLTSTEYQVALTVMRKTWGWNKKQDWISYTQFMKATKKSRISIWTALNKLVKHNILVKQTELGKMTRYQLNKDFDCWKLVKLDKPVKKTELVKQTEHTSKASLTRLVKQTEPTKDTITKDTITKENSIVSFLDSFNKLFERHYQPTEGRIKKLTLRLKTFSLEDILKALYNLSQSPFHRGINDRGWSADPDFLLRSDEQIDKWLNIDMAQAKQLSKLNKETKNANKFIGSI